ncbi:DUF1622 domain-containing protein [Deinococcus pimensis]|uniref:DUF1622 domain-containing protein n=1 Tax=Deinococcus pimensis TaxID=309888 RepID=UPI00048634EE|nr:DUF1622 domain-containing protein [Deinococcus pimensis]
MLSSFESSVRALTSLLAVGVEGAAGLVVAFAVIEALWRSARLLLPGAVTDRDAAKLAVRLRLGRWLAVVLEFLLAADVLRTAIAPTWDDIGKLAAIAAIRTTLNYFLEREVEAAETHASPSAGRA